MLFCNIKSFSSYILSLIGLLTIDLYYVVHVYCEAYLLAQVAFTVFDMDVCHELGE